MYIALILDALLLHVDHELNHVELHLSNLAPPTAPTQAPARGVVMLTPAQDQPGLQDPIYTQKLCIPDLTCSQFVRIFHVLSCWNKIHFIVLFVLLLCAEFSLKGMNNVVPDINIS